MKLKIAVSSGVLLLSLAGIAHGQGISFVGSIVERGCEVARIGAMNSTDAQQIDVGARLRLEVNRVDNVCRHGTIPFTARYEPLVRSGGHSSSESEAGVVTITYL